MKGSFSHHAPQNQDLTSMSLIVGEFLAEYGWYLLVGTVLVYLLIQQLNKRRSSWSSRRSAPPQDAALIVRKQEGMEAARRKMQEELDAKAAIFREKQREQEEKRRQNAAARTQGRYYIGTASLSQTTEEAGPSTAATKPKTDRKPLRSADYNPLSGQGGGSCSWRPGRRGPSSGG